MITSAKRHRWKSFFVENICSKLVKLFCPFLLMSGHSFRKKWCLIVDCKILLYFRMIFFNFSPFLSLPLSHFATSIRHVLDCLCLIITHFAPSFLSFHPISVLSLLIPTSESCHHFSLFCILFPQILRNFLFHFLTGIPFSLIIVFSLSPFSPCSFSFLSSILPLPPICLQTLPLSSLTMQPGVFLSTPSILLKYFSCTFSASSCSFYIPRSLLPTSVHSLPYFQTSSLITSPLSLSYSPNTSHIPFLHLIRSSFLQCITQVFELLYLLYFPSFPFPLILSTLP
jgi:hypothetical protein